MNKFKRILPWISLISFLFLVICSILVYQMRSAMLTTDGKAKERVLNEIDAVLNYYPSAINDKAFMQDVKTLVDQPYIASVWLFDNNGEALINVGSTALTGSFYELASEDIKDMINSLPNDSLTDEQVKMVLVVSAIRREGEHNDIYDHLVQTISDQNGSSIGFLGIAYEVNSEISTPVLWKISLLLGAFLLILYWISLPLWVYLDAKDRNEPALIWAMFVVLGNLVALMAYLMVRYKIKEN